MRRYLLLSPLFALALWATALCGKPVAAQSPASLATGFVNGQVTSNGTSMR